VAEALCTALISPTNFRGYYSIKRGVFSAFGMLMSDLRRDYIRTDVMDLKQKNFQTLQNVFHEMEVAIMAYNRDNYEKKTSFLNTILI
jgi:N-methylhydantoinase A/oxoprolinase/acetone carboxylase beta subunit